MIVIYPLLLSDTVSKNIVPGLAKVIERYLLIYKMDEILQSAKSGGYRKKLKVQGGKLIIKEQDDDEDLWEPDSRTKPEKEKPLTPEEEELGFKRDRETREAKKALDNAKSASMDIGTMDMQSLSAEPTWVKIEVQTGDIKTSEFIGVKVVPVIVKSSEKLVRILMFDKNVKGLHGEVLTFGRKSIRWLWKIWQKIWSTVPLVGRGRGIVTGDIRQDILLQKTI